jgi:hypothetical protein
MSGLEGGTGLISTGPALCHTKKNPGFLHRGSKSAKGRPSVRRKYSQGADPWPSRREPQSGKPRTVPDRHAPVRLRVRQRHSPPTSAAMTLRGVIADFHFSPAVWALVKQSSKSESQVCVRSSATASMMSRHSASGSSAKPSSMLRLSAAPSGGSSAASASATCPSTLASRRMRAVI